MSLDLDTSNKFMVAARGDHLCAMALLSGRMLTAGEALNLAAWLVVMATIVGKDVTVEDFQALLAAVQAT